MSIPEIKSELISNFQCDNFVHESDESLGCCCRHWGNWELPEDADEENCDNEVLTEESYIKLKAILANMRERYPKYYIDYNFSEKNYIDFSAILKK